jgi:hypothetical protein
MEKLSSSGLCRYCSKRMASRKQWFLKDPEDFKKHFTEEEQLRWLGERPQDILRREEDTAVRRRMRASGVRAMIPASGGGTAPLLVSARANP